MDNLNLVSALLLGIMGAGHCIAMCGGIISSLSMSNQSQPIQKRAGIVFLYQLGRIFSYSLIGLAGGFLGFKFSQLSQLPILELISGLLLVGMSLYVSRLWMGLSYLEKIGKLFWNKISPLSKHFLPVKTSRQAFLLGSLWGWLPCGLVYTSLSFAITMGDALYSALFMFIFGLGTLPGTLLASAAGLSLKHFLNHIVVRYLISICFLIFGVITLNSAFESWTGNGHHHHHHQPH